MPNKVLVTGSNGFVGKILIQKLIEKSHSPRAIVRDGSSHLFNSSVEVFSVPDINKETQWASILKGCEILIHTAARVHVMKDKLNDPLQEFRKVNVAGTMNLAEQAAASGIKRFIFISSIKVSGDETTNSNSFTSQETWKPIEPYAVSKYEAEQQLLDLSQRTGMEVVIIRPPLVYGPDVKGNFKRIIYWISKGIPIPLGAIHNKRSFVSVFNLVDLIIRCIDHPNAPNQIFLVSDGEDISTTELLKKIGKAMATPVFLIPVPAWLLKGTGSLLGKKELIQRLCGSLQVDISKTCELLDWKPIISMDETLAEIANCHFDKIS